MKKIIGFIKNDYRSVSAHWHMKFKKIPQWLIFIYYVLMCPIGLIASLFILPFVAIVTFIRTIKSNKDRA